MKIKKLTAIFLSLLIIFSFTGCFEDQGAEQVDNVSNGVDLFTSISKSLDLNTYKFNMTVSWVIPNFMSEGTEDTSSTFAPDSSSEANNEQTASSSDNVLNSIFKNKMLIEGVVVRKENGMDFSAKITVAEKTFDFLYVDSVCYIGAKDLINELLGKEVLKNEYISISKSSIESLTSSASDLLAGTSTDAVADDFSGTLTPSGDTTGDSISLDGVKLPEITLEKLSALLKPLFNGMKDAFASKQFNIFSVEDGFNVMKVTEKDVLLVVKNILMQYRSNSSDLYSAIQTAIKDFELDQTVTLTQDELNDALDNYIVTVQDAIDLDELEGMSFSLVVKSKADDNMCQNIFDFDVQKDSKQYSLEIDMSKTKDDDAAVTVPTNTAAIENIILDIASSIDLSGGGNSLISEPDIPNDEVTIW